MVLLLQSCIARACAYAPYSDMIWMETSKPDMEQVCLLPTCCPSNSSHLLL